MPIILDHRLREQMTHVHAAFPITFFRDELATLPNYDGPLHWHPDFEIATAMSGVLDFQIGLQHITLRAGESIFVNGNVLHCIRQVGGEEADPMPNIVFSGSVVAAETSAIYQKYIQPIAQCGSLPYIAFNQDKSWHRDVNRLAMNAYRQLQEKSPCYEMRVQRSLSAIFEHIMTHQDELPRYSATRVQLNTQIRTHKMLAYIHDHYREPLLLKDIAAAANISASEAGRCFNSYMGCSPIEALVQRRLREARTLLRDTMMTLQEISYACGFNSVSYFIRQFRKAYGRTPGQARALGK